MESVYIALHVKSSKTWSFIWSFIWQFFNCSKKFTNEGNDFHHNALSYSMCYCVCTDLCCGPPFPTHPFCSYLDTCSYLQSFDINSNKPDHISRSANI